MKIIFANHQKIVIFKFNLIIINRCQIENFKA